MNALMTLLKLIGGQIIIGLTVIVICVIVGYASTFIWNDNNLAEKIAESIIEKELGLPNGTIDLNHSHKDK